VVPIGLIRHHSLLYTVSKIIASALFAKPLLSNVFPGIKFVKELVVLPIALHDTVYSPLSVIYRVPFESEVHE
jgi:ABC-type sulfate transport system permease component